jgi:hypothetical protein
MSDALKNGGFASMPEPLYRDMFLRDWFAGQALANSYTDNDASPDKVAEWAYHVADAMLAQREAIRPARYLTVAAEEYRG